MKEDDNFFHLKKIYTDYFDILDDYFKEDKFNQDTYKLFYNQFISFQYTLFLGLSENVKEESEITLCILFRKYLILMQSNIKNFGKDKKLKIEEYTNFGLRLTSWVKSHDNSRKSRRKKHFKDIDGNVINQENDSTDGEKELNIFMDTCFKLKANGQGFDKIKDDKKIQKEKIIHTNGNNWTLNISAYNRLKRKFGNRLDPIPANDDKNLEVFF